MVFAYCCDGLLFAVVCFIVVMCVSKCLRCVVCSMVLRVVCCMCIGCCWLRGWLMRVVCGLLV